MNEIRQPVDEVSLENEIKAKGLNAPRLTPEHIDAQIVAESYHVFPGTALTICALTLKNGFQVVGESAAASLENFNADIGQRLARENARRKIWQLEGYLLRTQLAQLAEPAPDIEGMRSTLMALSAFTCALADEFDVDADDTQIKINAKGPDGARAMTVLPLKQVLLSVQSLLGGNFEIIPSRIDG